MSSLFKTIIEKRLGGFKHLINSIDQNEPMNLKESKKVAVIGAGIAGMSAATLLAERGFEVDIYERDNFLGGKVGSWPHTFSDSYSTNVEHGFHAFFRQYYNLRNLLKNIDAYKYLIPIDDYLIMTKELGDYSFKEIKTTPIENILSMRRAGIYSIKDIIRNPRFNRLISLLNYDKNKTYEKFDHISFKEFAEEANLPPQMRLMFTTFSRAFFAEPQLISMAELIKSFHFYFLSNDHGLIYDVMNDDFEKTLWQPARQFLQRNNAKINLSTPVVSFEKYENKFLLNDEEYGYVIMASDIKGTKSIIGDSYSIKFHHPEFYSQIQNQKQSQRYAVLRIWTDKDVREEIPFFTFTDALQILDSVTVYHRMEETSREWVKNNGGGIFELHSYALPDNFQEADVRGQFLSEFESYFPEIKGCKILYEYLQVKDDFTAFHTNLHKNRPGYNTKIKNFYLAGDWVRLDCPAMLMEAATTSALFSANEIFKKESLKKELIYSVPLKGVMA